MKCPRCQHESAADAVFCQECGTRLEAVCPGCETANQLGAKFCKKCGQPLASTPPAATAAKFPSPESYTPKHLAEKILTSKSALEGERKQVTVLFADLKGSMELLADRDPEEARKIFDPVLERMMEAVHRYEGTVNQVMATGSWRAGKQRHDGARRLHVFRQRWRVDVGEVEDLQGNLSLHR
jgi:hypothetical protein